MPGLSFKHDSTYGYRFGFNGQERDGEFGDYYAFEYRIHDARLGRFLSVDLASFNYPWQSTYCIAHNNPIKVFDWLGLGDPKNAPVDPKRGQEFLDRQGSLWIFDMVGDGLVWIKVIDQFILALKTTVLKGVQSLVVFGPCQLGDHMVLLGEFRMSGTKNILINLNLKCFKKLMLQV